MGVELLHLSPGTADTALTSPVVWMAVWTACPAAQRGRKRSQGDKDRQLLEHMVEYCQDAATCRHTALLRYFGEQQGGGRCGTSCDVCLGQVVPLQVPAKKGKRGSRGSAAAEVAQAAAQEGVEDDDDWLVEDDQERGALGGRGAVPDSAGPGLYGDEEWQQQEHGGEQWEQHRSSSEELEGPGVEYAPPGAAAGAWGPGGATQYAAPRFAAASTLLATNAGAAGAPHTTSAGGLGLLHGLPVAGVPGGGRNSKRPPLQQRPAPQGIPTEGAQQQQAAGSFDHSSAWSAPACRGFIKASALLQERKANK
jgi:hypothetical protein